jgi:phosphocarrier protein HPr
MATSATVELRNPSGLHARPAKVFATTAAGTGHTVRLTKGERTVNGASVLSVLTLGCHRGDLITIEVEGAEQDRVLAELVELVASGMGEPLE